MFTLKSLFFIFFSKIIIRRFNQILLDFIPFYILLMNYNLNLAHVLI